MLKKKRRKNNTEVNAGSMADIAFLLLIFFLVTTQIAEDQGILVQLPPFSIENPPPPPSKNVLMVLVNAKDELLVEGERARVTDLRKMTKEFIANPQQLKTLPTSPKNAIISLKNDRSTSYETYIGVYNELKAAYRELRDEEAQKLYAKNSFELLNKDQRKVIKDKIPLVISEAEPTNYVQ